MYAQVEISAEQMRNSRQLHEGKKICQSGGIFGKPFVVDYF
jgi:hypothetical protein